MYDVKTKRILLVEDDAMVCQLLSNVLAFAGYSLEAAHDGREALERLQRERFDLIITDLQMPDVDGLSLLRGVELMGLDVPSIILSGVVDDALIAQGRELGARDYIAKPIMADELLERVALQLEPA